LVAALVSAANHKAKNPAEQPGMSLVAHKYTPAEMTPEELESTFAAREHTVEYLLDSLRRQIHAGTLSSFIITGPRGSGKSTIIQMVALRLNKDPKLKAAWIPVVFPEEQFDIGSLRDLMTATLRMLAKQGIAQAQSWLDRVEAEPNEEQSLQFALMGLRQITREHRKRLILFIENLDQLLGECFDDLTKSTFRRLLMSDPFMMVIGSAVHVFDSLKNYDEAFFNYFGQVPLGRLAPEDVFDLLRRRAEFDRNQDFLREFPGQKPKLRAIVLLSGGNPRLTLMLYELLSQRQITTIVGCLQRLVDELTPLLKHEIENLPPQQRQIIHALMEKGGTAQPTELVGRTRLPLNAITTQLGRLKDAQIVEVLGGGKGRKANYTIPDKLFAIWFQMRYLQKNRRRIEMFVEVLRIWFEEEERLSRLRALASQEQHGGAQVLREAATAEYYAASLQGTAYERLATELCINQWAKTNLREAALVYADFLGGNQETPVLNEMQGYLGVADLLVEHGDYERALHSLDEVISKRPKDVTAMAKRAFIKLKLNDFCGAIADLSVVIEAQETPKKMVARALVDRAAAKGLFGDVQGAIADCENVINMKDAPKDQVALALFNRGVAMRASGNLQGAISDYTEAIKIVKASKECVAQALFNRGAAKTQLGDYGGAISDYSRVIAMEGVPGQEAAQALFNRGNARQQSGDLSGAASDYTALIRLEGALVQVRARALINLGVTKQMLGDTPGAISDWTTVIDMEGAPKDQIARALFARWLVLARRKNTAADVHDLFKVLDLAVMENDLAVVAAVNAFGILWLDKKYSKAKEAVTKLGGVLNNLTKDPAITAALQFFNRIAFQLLKDAWPTAWRALVETSKPEVAEALRFLEPVCSVLEGKDRTLLDGLPPEQREFAEKVLKNFGEA
jgi:tetratricopeptide (TPR) repeat protein